MLQFSDLDNARINYKKIQTTLNILDAHISKLFILLSKAEQLTVEDFGKAKAIYRQIKEGEFYLSSKLNEMQKTLNSDGLSEEINNLNSWFKKFDKLFKSAVKI